MKKNSSKKSPQTLDDVSHLFFSDTDEPLEKKADVKRPRAQDALDFDELLDLLQRHADRLCADAMIIDDDAREACGADLLLAEASGNPVFLHLLRRDPLRAPFRMLDHMARLARNPKLFLRAYGAQGVSQLDDPLFLFVLPACPADLVHAIERITWARVKLFHARNVVLDGNSGVLFTPAANGAQPSNGQAVFLSTEE